MKAFSPQQVKADLILVLGVAATFGFKLTETQQIAVLSGSVVLCAALNFAEAHVKVNAGVLSAVEKALGEIKLLLASGAPAPFTEKPTVTEHKVTVTSPSGKGQAPPAQGPA